MAKNKESFFWTSYSDLMTSLFFIMLTLFVLVIVLLHKRMETTEEELRAIKEIEQSTKNLNKRYFEYKQNSKKYQLRIQVEYPRGDFDIQKLVASTEIEREQKLNELRSAGMEIQQFLKRNKDYQYLMIIEGQASKDNYTQNYELSYQRALGLIRYWINVCNLDFGANCEIQISGSGDGTIKTLSDREIDEVKNQRFLIHILPKNIIENAEKK